MGRHRPVGRSHAGRRQRDLLLGEAVERCGRLEAGLAAVRALLRRRRLARVVAARRRRRLRRLTRTRGEEWI